MDENFNNSMINGANADMIYVNIADYLSILSKNMFKKHNKLQRAGKQISWEELDEVNKDLHHQLDVIVAGTEIVSENAMKQRERIVISESQLKSLIVDSVNKYLKT